MFIVAIGFIGSNGNAIPLKCASMRNQERKVRLTIMNIISNEPLFYPNSAPLNKYSGSCNDINSPYAKLLVPDVVKNMNIKVFNLMSRTNETRQTCGCKCRLDASICNDKQRWNSDKCRCECKELIDKGRCNDRIVWNPSIRECEWDKSCDVGE